MFQQIAWRTGMESRLKKQAYFLPTCLKPFVICLVITMTGIVANADSPEKVIQSAYSIDNTVNKNIAPENNTEAVQTQFSRRKKTRKKKSTNDQQIDYSQFVKVISKGSSRRSARKKGLASLPLNQLSSENRAKANNVLRKVSMYRELPVISLNSDHDVYQYFLKNPDVAVEIWRVMGISKFQMWQVNDHAYGADAGDGSKGDVDVLYRTPTESLIVCNGVYDSPFLVKPIAARALMYLESNYQYDQQKNPIVTHKMRLFISFPSQTIGAAARIISPVSNMIIDKNFHEVSLFLHMMTRSMSEHPEWVEQLTGKMDGVMDFRKQKLLKLTSKVYQENKKLKISQAGGISANSNKLAARKKSNVLR